MNVTLHINGQPVTVELLERKAHEVRFRLNGTTFRFLGQKTKDGAWLVDEETSPDVWTRHQGTLWHAGKNTYRLQSGAQEIRISEVQPGASPEGGAASALSPTAPMPGAIRKILTRKGASVKDGDPLIVMEAMKLQLTLSAGGDGIVSEICVREGEMVAEGTELVRITGKKG